MTQKFLFTNANGFYEEDIAYTTSEFLTTSAGAGDAGKPIVLDAGGKIDASMLEQSDIDHGTISGLGDDDHTQYTLADGTRAFTGDQSMGSNKLTNLADGTAANDAVNLAQLQAQASGHTWKDSVRAATTAALTLASDFENGDAIDGITLATGDRILIKDQAAGAENGIYTVNATGAPTRATDMDAGTEADGASVMIQEGSTQADSQYHQSTESVTIGTTAQVWVQISGLGQVAAGAGLTKTGNTIDAGAGTGITVNADDIAIDFSTAFNDTKAVAAEDLNSTANGEGASIIGIEDSAGNFTATDVEAALAELFTAITSSEGVTYTVGTGGVTKGDLCIINAADTVITYATIANSDYAVGLAKTTEAAAGNVAVSPNDFALTGVLTGQTAGARQFWTGSAHSTTIPAGSGSHVWQTGVAKNATDLAVEVAFVKKNV